MRLRPRKSAREHAVRLLPRLARKFFRAGDREVKPGAAPGRIHAFRIRTKRFRYSLEFFRRCYGQPLDSHLKRIKELQDSLGAVTDCWSTQRLYHGTFPTALVRSPKLRAALDGRLTEMLAAACRHWSSTFQEVGLRQRMLRYLGHPPVGSSRRTGRQRTRQR